MSKDYVLTCRVVNYDPKHTYTITDSYGVNEEISDPEFAPSRLPAMDAAGEFVNREMSSVAHHHASGTQRWIPGVPFPVTLEQSIAYYNIYTIKNQSIYSGGFQIAMGVKRDGVGGP